MAFFWLKIIHVLSAGLIVGGGGLCYLLVRIAHRHASALDVKQHMKRAVIYTWSVLTLLVFVQLFTGFSMISVKPYSMHAGWVIATFSGFVAFAISGLFTAQSLTRCYDILCDNLDLYQSKAYHNRYNQFKWALRASALCLLFILFFMINRPHF